jgi:hypothetical protein
MVELEDGLDDDGAIIRVWVALGADDEQHFENQGRPVPEPFYTTALIDTGASRTVVRPDVIAYLQSVQSGFSIGRTVTRDGHEREVEMPLHDLRIIPGGHPASEFHVQAVAMHPATPGVSLLVGRDLLVFCIFTYDGWRRRFKIAF